MVNLIVQNIYNKFNQHVILHNNSIKFTLCTIVGIHLNYGKVTICPGIIICFILLMQRIAFVLNEHDMRNKIIIHNSVFSVHTQIRE